MCRWGSKRDRLGQLSMVSWKWSQWIARLCDLMTPKYVPAFSSFLSPLPKWLWLLAWALQLENFVSPFSSVVWELWAFDQAVLILEGSPSLQWKSAHQYLCMHAFVCAPVCVLLCVRTSACAHFCMCASACACCTFLCVCMFLHVCIAVCAHFCVFTHLCVRFCVCVLLRGHFLHVCFCVCALLRVCFCVCTSACVRLCVYFCVCASVCSYTFRLLWRPGASMVPQMHGAQFCADHQWHRSHSQTHPIPGPVAIVHFLAFQGTWLSRTSMTREAVSSICSSHATCSPDAHLLVLLLQLLVRPTRTFLKIWT